MLRYPYFCRIYKNFLSCWLESGIFNLGVWPKKIHATAERYNEYEAQEEKDQTGVQELHRSQDRDSGVMTKLHIPVMVDEVVHCLAPQKGQVFLDMTFGSGGHTRAILQKEPDITLYALDRDPTAYAIAEQLSELYPYLNMHSASIHGVKVPWLLSQPSTSLHAELCQCISNWI